jgi:hypothetical protein
MAEQVRIRRIDYTGPIIDLPWPVNRLKSRSKSNPSSRTPKLVVNTFWILPKMQSYLTDGCMVARRKEGHHPRKAMVQRHWSGLQDASGSY